MLLATVQDVMALVKHNIREFTISANGFGDEKYKDEMSEQKLRCNLDNVRT